VPIFWQNFGFDVIPLDLDRMNYCAAIDQQEGTAIKKESKKVSKYEPFLNMPSMRTFNFMLLVIISINRTEERFLCHKE
jgi:hypothetical protein